MSIKILEIDKKKRIDLINFTRLPYEIYKDYDVWIPPPTSEIIKYLRCKDVLSKNFSISLFLAYDNNKIVGRCAALVDETYLELKGDDTGFFSFFEVLNGQEEAAHQLLSRVEDSLRAEGLKTMRGPYNWGDYGYYLLVDGFSYAPFGSSYNPPYYKDILLDYGLSKEKEFYSYLIDITKPLPKSLMEKVDASEQDGVRVRSIDFKYIKDEANTLADIIFEVFKDHWGVRPLTLDEIEYMLKEIKRFRIPNFFKIAEIAEDPAGILLSLPDFNLMYRKFKGTLGLKQLFQMLYYKSRMNDGLLFKVGVRQKYRGRGAALLMATKAIEDMQKWDFKSTEYTLVLEGNIASNALAKKLGGEIYKTYWAMGKKL